MRKFDEAFWGLKFDFKSRSFHRSDEKKIIGFVYLEGEREWPGVGLPPQTVPRRFEFLVPTLTFIWPSVRGATGLE